MAVILVRSLFLASDSFGRLDWSAGLLTDEGFYTHNARNAVALGSPRTDDFNNMLLSPLLHVAQIVAFRLGGVSVVPVRVLSVLCSLAAIALMWDALRRVFGRKVAWTSVVILGLDHSMFLFHRMALMDTPASFGAAAGFWLFVRGLTSKSSWWFAACGALIMATVLNRSLCLFMIPAPFIALWFGVGPESKKRIGFSAAGIAVVAITWWAVWARPNSSELRKMTTYYRTQQVQPKSIVAAVQNVEHALFGDHRGMAPYLFRHSPMVFAMALCTLPWLLRRRKPAPDETAPSSDPLRAVQLYLVVWLVAGWGLLSVISYSPARYYVSTYPAMAALASIGVWRLREVTTWHHGRKWLAESLAAFLAFHAVESVVHRGGVLPDTATWLLLVGIPAACAFAIARTKRPISVSPLCIATVWVIANGVWTAGWLRTMDDSQYRTSVWIRENTPPNAVLIGDVAPGLNMEAGRTAVSVIPGLCNDKDTLSRWRGRPRYVLILDGLWREKWWDKNYPMAVAPENRVKLARVLRWDVGIYRVPDSL